MAPEEQALKFSPRKLRNHSQSQSQSGINPPSNKMSGILPENAIDLSTGELIQKEEFAKKSTAQKLDSVADAINKMYDEMSEVTTSLEEKIKPINDVIFEDNTGLLSQLEATTAHTKGLDDGMQTLAEENLKLRDELDILKGVVHKMANQLDIANGKINQLVAKSMEDNLVITGVLDDFPKKKVRKQVHQFFQEQLGLLNVRDDDILKVYRIGQPQQNRHRAIMVHCTPELRRYIINNSSNLRDRLNEEGGKYYINQQLPESIAEQKREIRQIIREKQQSEEMLPQTSKSKFLVKNNKVFINGQISRKLVEPPSVTNLFPEEDTQKKIDAIKLRTFRSKPEAGSMFRVAIFRPDNINSVRLAYTKMFQQYPAADHIAMAASIDGKEAYQDNGEFGSGFRMLKAIQLSPLNNVALFMIRQFGRIHLGPRRFVIINDLATIALQKAEEQQNLRTVRSPSSTGSSSSDKHDDSSQDSDANDDNQDDAIQEEDNAKGDDSPRDDADRNDVQ